MLRLNAQGWNVPAIAKMFECHEHTVRATIKRSPSSGLSGLWEADGRGAKLLPGLLLPSGSSCYIVDPESSPTELLPGLLLPSGSRCYIVDKDYTRRLDTFPQCSLNRTIRIPSTY